MIDLLKIWNQEMQRGVINFTLILIILFYFTNCTHKRETYKAKTQSSIELIDSFIDSVHIGKQEKNKIELSKFIIKNKNSSFIIIKLFEKDNNKWKLTYQDSIESDKLAIINPEIKDYNLDGFGDVKFCVAIGANLANSIYTVFIFSNESKSLKNIGKGWNLLYSKKLKLFREKYIASTIWARFYDIKSDSLQIKFEVDLGITESVKEYDVNGKIKMIYKAEYNEANESITKVKHWLREWAVKDTIN